MRSTTITYNFDDFNMSGTMEVEIHQHQKTHKSKKTLLIPMPQTIDDHPLEKWANANPLSDARYGDKSTNIFMQIQEEPIPGSGPGDEDDAEDIWQNPLLLLSLPPPDDIPMDDNLAYFLSNRMDAFIGFQHCFSSAYKSLYLLSANTPVLRHTLFAFVKFLNEQDRQKQSELCNMHLAKAIPQLQHALIYLTFDETHILSIPLLAYLAFWSRSPETAKSHITGFYKMCIHAGYLEQDKFGKVSVTDKMPSLVLLMWRLAVRLDHYFGFLSPEQETIPLIKSTADSNRRYISEFIDPSAAQWTDCLVLTDELEDLRNMAVHFNRRANAIRASSDYTPEQARNYIDRAANKFIRRIEAVQGNIISAANDYNKKYNPTFEAVWYMTLDPFPSSRFLHYVPMFKSIHHRFIEAIVINQTTLIHTTMTMYPHTGPQPLDRLQAAIEICCAFATLKERMPFALAGRGKLLEALMFAGYTFCSLEHSLGMSSLLAKTNEEFQWVQTRLAEEAEFGHAGASKMSRILEVAWEKQEGTCWDFADMVFPRAISV
jgi:hypothetical protein